MLAEKQLCDVNYGGCSNSQTRSSVCVCLCTGCILGSPHSTEKQLCPPHPGTQWSRPRSPPRPPRPKGGASARLPPPARVFTLAGAAGAAMRPGGQEQPGAPREGADGWALPGRARCNAPEPGAHRVSKQRAERGRQAGAASAQGRHGPGVGPLRRRAARRADLGSSRAASERGGRGEEAARRSLSSGCVPSAVDLRLFSLSPVFRAFCGLFTYGGGARGHDSATPVCGAPPGVTEPASRSPEPPPRGAA